MIRYLESNLLRDRGIWIGVVILCVIGLMPFLLATPTSNYNFSPERFKMEQQILSDGMLAGAYDTAPSGLQELLGRESEAYGRILAQSPGSVLYYKAVDDLEGLQAEERGAGYLVGDDGVGDFCASIAGRLSDMREPGLFASARELPAAYYLSFLFSQVPSPVFFCLAFLVCWKSRSVWMSTSILFRSPIPAGRRYFTYLLLSIGNSVVLYSAVVFIICLPALAYNGIGYLEYPVAMLQGGGVTESTVGLSLAQSFTSVLLVSSLSAALMGLFLRCDGWAFVSLLILGGFSLLPMTPLFFGLGDAVMGAFYSSPLAVFDFNRVFGGFSYVADIENAHILIDSDLILLTACTLVIACVLLGVVVCAAYKEGRRNVAT